MLDRAARATLACALSVAACTQSFAPIEPIEVQLDIGLFREPQHSDPSALGSPSGSDLLVDHVAKNGSLEVRARSVHELGVDTTFTFARDVVGKTSVRVAATLHRVV